ncbi:LutC/YkgG family protein [Nitratifractor sp.]
MANAKSQILAHLGTTPPPEPLPEPDYTPLAFDDPLSAFARALEAAGGELRREKVDEILTNINPKGSVIDIRKSFDPEADPPAVLILAARLGVAENGAVWIDPQERYPRRWIPLAEMILIALDPAAIVATMHEAYAAIETDRIRYGVFLSGPSKTADIEQSLVLGAHGAGTLIVGLR